MTVRAAEWRRARAERRACDRQLPAGLARDLAVIRRDDLGHDAAVAVHDDVAAIAARAGQVRRVVTAGAPPWTYVRPAAQREIARALEQNPTYRRHVRARVRATLRTEHLTKVDPAADPLEVPDALGDAPLAGDTLRVQSSIGLGTATMLEAEPEGWNHWVAAQVRDEQTSADALEYGLGVEHHDCRVLVLGALAGGFARAVTALGLSSLAITEIDWVLPAATNLPCVERRGLTAPMRVFDAAVAVVPSPATSAAANQRNVYRASCSSDPARLGVRRWHRAVVGYLGLLNAALEIGSLAYVLLPLGIRDEHGYSPAPDVLGSLLSELGAVGFEVVLQVPTVELQPVRQPFVGYARPQKTTLVLKKTAPLEGL